MYNSSWSWKHVEINYLLNATIYISIIMFYFYNWISITRRHLKAYDGPSNLEPQLIEISIYKAESCLKLILMSINDIMPTNGTRMEVRPFFVVLFLLMILVIHPSRWVPWTILVFLSVKVHFICSKRGFHEEHSLCHEL